MAYQEAFARQLDAYVAGRTAFECKAMFGGMAYLLNGNMCFGTLNDDLILRIGVDAAEAYLGKGRARVFDITGRVMKGWIVVPIDAIEHDQYLVQEDDV